MFKLMRSPLATVMLAASLIVPSLASAQDVVTFMSNMAQSTSSNEFFLDNSEPRATRFTTGRANGYVLTEVEARMKTVHGLTNTRINSLKVSLWSKGDDNHPGEKIVDLTRTTSTSSVPSTLGVNFTLTFSVPANTVLTRNTEYFIHMVDSSTIGVVWVITRSHTEEIKLPHWDILQGSWVHNDRWWHIDDRGKMTLKGTIVGAATGEPSISGTAAVGQTLTAARGTIADPQGITKAIAGDADYAFTYQWIRVDDETETDISGATSDTYTVTTDDIGKQIKVRVSFQDDDGVPDSRTSTAHPSDGTVADTSNPNIAAMVMERSLWAFPTDREGCTGTLELATIDDNHACHIRRTAAVE